MDTLLVGFIVLASLAFLGARALGAWRRARADRDGCGSGCGCSPASRPATSRWDSMA